MNGGSFFIREINNCFTVGNSQDKDIFPFLQSQCDLIKPAGESKSAFALKFVIQ